MPSNKRLVLLAGIALVGLPLRAQAADRLELRAEDQQKSVDCKGLDVLIEGNRDTYTLRGGCKSIVLHGESDKVHATVAPGAHITIEGNDVDLTWRLATAGEEPVISVKGRDSHASRDSAATPSLALLPPPTLPVPPTAAPVPAAPPVARPSPAPPPAVAASPAPVLPPIAQPLPPPALPSPPPPPPSAPPDVASIVPMPRPSDSDAAPPSPPVALPAKPSPSPGASKGPPIEITIDGEARDLDCAGREVHISADNGLYALRGGCSAVIVHGDDDLIQAELLPGARIELIGKNLRLAYVQLGDGDAPKVHADGAKSQAWAISSWGGLKELPKN